SFIYPRLCGDRIDAVNQNVVGLLGDDAVSGGLPPLGPEIIHVVGDIPCFRIQPQSVAGYCQSSRQRPFQPISVSSPNTVYVGALFQYERSEEHTSELQSRENLVCRLPPSTLFPTRRSSDLEMMLSPEVCHPWARKLSMSSAISHVSVFSRKVLPDTVSLPDSVPSNQSASVVQIRSTSAPFSNM